MRLSAIIIAVALLFNFFAWYLLFISSKENKRLAEIVTLAANQRILGQRISNSSLLLLLNTGLAAPVSDETHETLQKSLAIFEKQHADLLHQLKYPAQLQNPVVLELKSRVNTDATNFISTGKEIAAADHAVLVASNTLYTNQLRLQGNRLLETLDAVTDAYIPLVIEKEKNTEKINTGKFVSLLIALGCVAMLLIEPLLRGNKNNLSHLQLAKVGLLQKIGLDASAKIQAQQSKEEAIQTLSYAMSYAKMGSWKYNMETQEFIMSAEMKSLLGLSDKDPDIISMDSRDPPAARGDQLQLRRFRGPRQSPRAGCSAATPPISTSPR